MPHHDDAPSRPITVTSGPERAEVVPQRAGLGIDYSATVEAAGLQSASPIERLSGLIREHEVAVVPLVDDAKLPPEITRLQKELHRDPIDAAITLEGGTARERTSEDGQDVPADALRTQLTAHWLNPDGVTVEPQPTAPRIGASALKEAMDGPVHRALFGPLTVNGREDVKAVAQMLVREPQLLLLDEPTSALDLHHQVSVLTIIRNIVAESERQAVVAIHDLNLAARYCDELLVMKAGRVITHGELLDVLTPELLQDVYGIEASKPASFTTQSQARPSSARRREGSGLIRLGVELVWGGIQRESPQVGCICIFDVGSKVNYVTYHNIENE
ncbi:hypothetical protein [Corynebacterium jeddahense]|uniref:Hemin import ATP-binding protein HmuV n=1 Tax=Corynebacterium jeddahense TaxID=1414719 RepID=A0ABY7UH47_9CORY|nr:hypothetical protein [Corynebacterium jeddahense]WCZ38050.1 Hemin import ATP-binding protein HmuV [Corynebacterium jeddahense]